MVPAQPALGHHAASVPVALHVRVQKAAHLRRECDVLRVALHAPLEEVVCAQRERVRHAVAVRQVREGLGAALGFLLVEADRHRPKL